MDRAILGLATDRGVLVLKPGPEATEYVVASQGLLNRHCSCLGRSGDGRLVAGTTDFFCHFSSDGQEWKMSLEGLSKQHITAFGRHPAASIVSTLGWSPTPISLSVD